MAHSYRHPITFLCAMLFSVNLLAGTLEFGSTLALSGPAQELGKNIKLGIDTYFASISKSGSLHGNELKLTAMDDKYEPSSAAPNMRSLIGNSDIMAIVGNVGTPTAVVTVPIANELKTLLFGAYTGAGLLRKTPPDRYVINYRASYAQETAAMVKYLLDSGIKPTEIAFFTQNDGYGDSGYSGAMAALKDEGFNNGGALAHGRYARNTTNVEDALATILSSDTPPKAIIMVGAYAPCAAFIKLAKDVFPETLYLNVSFVGADPLAKSLGPAGEGVIVTQVVPHFNQKSLPIIKDYLRDLAAFESSAKPNFISLEGYIIGRLLAEGVKKAGPDVNRESLITALESLKSVDIGLGFPITFGPDKHQASSQVWPTHIKGGSYASGWQ